MGGLEQFLRAFLETLSPSAPPSGPTETSLQNNIDRSTEYRREYYKYALGIATALLAFSISFQPQLRRAPEQLWLLIPGWGGLGLAVILGVRVHMVWAKFFITWRDWDHKKRDPATGKVKRDRLTAERHVLDFLLIAALGVGVAGVVAFAAVNLPNIATKADESNKGAAAPAAAPGGVPAIDKKAAAPHDGGATAAKDAAPADAATAQAAQK